MIVISGPCVIENEEIVHSIAEALLPLFANPNIDFYFKASFDKANRTSLESFRGLGLERGLEILQSVKQRYGYKIVTDIHESYQAEPVAQVADMLQIPAFLCRQTDLIVAAAKTKAEVNIKKGQFMNPKDMQYSVLKAIKTRGGSEASFEQSKQYGIFLTERGSSFGYGNLVVDMRSLAIMRKYAPVIFDATHSVQMPGAQGGKSGGDWTYAPILARAAFGVGIDGFFAETHLWPQTALSDGPNMLPTPVLLDLCQDLIAIDQLVKKEKQ